MLSDDDVEAGFLRLTGRKNGTLNYAQVVKFLTYQDIDAATDPYDGKLNGAAMSANQLNSTAPVDIFKAHRQEFTTDLNHPELRLCRQYLDERHFCDDQEFDHSLDCFYFDNLCDMELRGGHRFCRPTNCAKFMLKSAQWVFSNSDYVTAWHGTASANLPSILKWGLRPGNSWIDGVFIGQKHGAVFGPGVYMTLSPVYAALYAQVEPWGPYWVQTLLMVRVKASSIDPNQDESCGTLSLLERSDIHLLYGGNLGRDELQMKARNYSDVVVQGVIVKIHHKDPTAQGGEYHRISNVLKMLAQH
jgi:hypothetical protein